MRLERVFSNLLFPLTRERSADDDFPPVLDLLVVATTLEGHSVRELASTLAEKGFPSWSLIDRVTPGRRNTGYRLRGRASLSLT